MRNVSAVAAILLLAGAPVALAQTTTSPAPAAANSSSTAGSGTTSAPGKMSDQEIRTKLEGEGYSQVTNISSTPEGITAKAMKGNKAVALVIDSSGKVKESQIGP